MQIDTTLDAPPSQVSAALALPTDAVAWYQIRCQGAAWSSVRRCALADEIARVEGIFAAERERASGIDLRGGWIERSYEFGTSLVAVEVIHWDHATRVSTVIARWIGGEQRPLSQTEHGQALTRLTQLA